MRETSVKRPVRVLHAGFHKTGSTFLQKELFPKLRECTYFHKFSLHQGPLLCNYDTRAVLFSSEASCGLPYPITPPFSPNRLLTNIRVLGISKVFVVKRPLHSWTRSLYLQTLKAGYWWSIDEFIERNRDNLYTWNEAPTSIARTLAENGIEFACFDHEDLRSSPQETCNEICRFIGTEPVEVSPRPVNASLYGSRAIAWFRFVNRLGQVRIMRPVYRALSVEPLRMMKARPHRIGTILDKYSANRLTTERIQQLLD